MAEQSQKNYTTEQQLQLLKLYEDLGTDKIDEIAAIMSKPVKSIRSKLVREGVYKPSEKVVDKNAIPSKKEILNELETILGFDTTGLMGSTKPVLLQLLKYLQE